MLEAIQIDLPPEDELSAYKKRVREVAHRYATKYEWCHVIDDVLQELDIPKSDLSKVDVQFSTSFGLDLLVSVGPGELAGKTAQEQVEALLSCVNPLTIRHHAAARPVDVTLTADQVLSMTLVAKEERFSWRYCSGRGRVLHAFDLTEPAAYGRYSACTRIYSYREELAEQAQHGTGQRCARCQTAVDEYNN